MNGSPGCNLQHLIIAIVKKTPNEESLDTKNQKEIAVSMLLFKELLFLGFLFLLVQKYICFLCLSRNKTKIKFGKNSTLTHVKILPKFDLFVYKLNFQNKNHIYKIK